MAIKKITVSLNEQVIAYIDKTAKDIGVSRSAMIAFMAETYKAQRESKSTVEELGNLFNKIAEEAEKNRN